MIETLPALHDDYLPYLPSSQERRIIHLLEGGNPVIVLTIIRTEGNVARKAGTRALYTGQALEGSLGGGLFESRVLEEAERCLESRQSCLFSFTGIDDAGRGKRDVCCEYLSPDNKELFVLAADLLEKEIRAVWMLDITRPASPLRSLILAKEPSPSPDFWHSLQLSGKVLPDARLLAKILHKSAGKPMLQRDGGTELYLEPFTIAPVLLLCGANAVALATAKLARQCGFTIDIADDGANLDPSLFPMARNVFSVPSYSAITTSCAISDRHFVVIMTHNHDADLKCLSQILHSHAAYIGMLGSSAKRTAIFATLKEQGIPSTELAAVHCPVGLQIGAETPEQVAVSIVAELLAAQTGTLRFLRKA